MDHPRCPDSASEPSPFGDVDSDAELLKAFAAASPGSSSAQAVLTQIVARHGTMVYQVAQRMVSDPTLVDDVFQATFLVLAQSARKIQKTASLASWLHGTARNIGRRALHDKYGVRSQTTAGAEMVTAVDDDPFTEMIRSHERQLLDEELQQLPEIYRAPLVLHYFEQRSNPEISQWLGITVAAVESRLKRAKQLLRVRLVRRGMTLSVAVVALGASSSVATATPSVALVTSTVTLAATTPAITASLTTVAASAALQLAGKELATMSAASKITALLLTTAGTLTLGGAVLFGAAYGGLNGQGQGTATASIEPNGLIETDAAAGTLHEEPLPMTLAMSNDPPKVDAEAPAEAKAESSKAAEAPPQESADIVEKVKQDTQKIRSALDQTVTFEFNKTPLKDALASMSDKCGINIKLDTEGLNDIGINEDTPIDMVVEGITLQSSLKFMLENVNGQTLDYILEDGTLIVGSEDRIYRKMNERDFDDIIQRRLGNTYQHILNALDDQVTFNLPDTTLAAGLGAIADKCGIAIVLHSEGAWYTEKSPVSLVAHGIPLRAALSKMLSNVDGKRVYFLVDGEQLRVGPPDSLMKAAKLSRIGRRLRPSPDPFLIAHGLASTLESTGAAATTGTPRVLAPNSTEGELAESSEINTPPQTQPSQGTTTTITGSNIQVTTKDTQINASEVRVNGAASNQGGTSHRDHKAPIVAAIRNLSAGDRKVYEALDQTTRLEFPDNTIHEIFDFLANLHEINIRFDRRSLEFAGVNIESRIQCTIGDVSLRTALPLILESAADANLDYYVDGGILFITTEDAVANKGCLRFYDLSSELVNLSEVIAKYAQGFEADEPGTLTLTSFGDCLAIETSFDIHKKIEEMIVGVMQVAEARKAAGKEFVIPKPNSAQTRLAPAQPAPSAAEPQQPAGADGGSGAAGEPPAQNSGGGFGGGGGGFN